MNYSLLFIGLLFVQGLNFDNLEQVLKFDPFTIKDCSLKTDFLQAFEIFNPWIKMIEDSDTQNQLQIQRVQEILQELKQLLQQNNEQQKIENNDQVQNNQIEIIENQQIGNNNQVELDNQQQETIQLMNTQTNIQESVIKYQQELLSLEINGLVQNIIQINSINNNEDINEMIQFCENILNHQVQISIQQEQNKQILEELKDKQQTIQHLAKNCGQSINNNSEQLLEKAKLYKSQMKQKRKNQVSFLQVVMDDEDSQHHQLEYQKQLLKNQGMLGFLRTQGN